MSKLIPILNVNAFAEGYFQKSAALGVGTDEALGLLLVKQAGGWGTALKALGVAALPAAGWLGRGAVDAGVNAPTFLDNLLNAGKNYGLTAVGTGAGVGGLAWLLKENAKAEAAKKLMAQQAVGKAQSQQAELQKAFAPVQEEKVKPYTTVGQSTSESGYEV